MFCFSTPCCSLEFFRIPLPPIFDNCVGKNRSEQAKRVKGPVPSECSEPRGMPANPKIQGTQQKMKKQIFLSDFCALLLFANAFAETAYAAAESYQSSHFTIYSDLDPCYMQFVQANAEAYYENLKERYFQTGWQNPLTIYYSRTQSDTQKLLNEHGHRYEVGSGYYEPTVSAVYSHQFMDNGTHTSWGMLFHEITHHFTKLNYRNPPAWFYEGLASFLGEQSQIVKDKLIIGSPDPWREQILRDKIEQGRRPNIKRLFSSSTEQFHDWDLGHHFARAFFYWLHVPGQL